MMKLFILLFALILTAAQGQAANDPALPAAASAPDRAAMVRYAAESGERTWQSAQQPDLRNPSSRDLFTYALALCEAKLHPERLERLFEVAAQMQDQDPASRSYGNFHWSWAHTKVEDFNAVDFCIQGGALLWLRHRDTMPPAARARLRAMLTLAVEGLKRHRVREDYTNIALMNAGDLILLGEALGETAVASEGYTRLDHIVLAIGDVSGKGVPAALFMAVTRSFLRSEFRVEPDPGRTLSRVNDELSEGNDSCMFVTLFCAVVRLSDGFVRYANGGHNPPIRLHDDGSLEWISTPHGMACGASSGVEYTTGSFHLNPAEYILLYTDGVTEAMNPDLVLYGEDRLASCILGMGAPTCRSALETILDDVRAHAAGAEQSDDITMLMFNWKASTLKGEAQT